MNKRFSLLSLLVFTALVAVSIAFIVERKRSSALLEMNQKIGKELGHFKVEDPGRTYVRQVLDYGPYAYRFRIHLPKGKKYNLGVGTIGLKKDGQPDYSLITKNQGNFSTSQVASSGQFTLGISIRNFDNQTPVGVTEIGNNNSTSIDFVSSHINNIFGDYISNNSEIQLSSNYGEHGDIAGFSADEPIVLFQAHHDEKDIMFRNTQLEEVFIVALMPVN